MAPGRKKPLVKPEDAANLRVLQREDPEVEAILGSASHVTLYGFNLEEQAWHRKDCEGSLFVVQRRTVPRFQFVVLNRLNTENVREDLLGEFEFELSPPYLLYRSSTEVNGIWFFQQEECDDMSALFDSITSAHAKEDQAAPQQLTAQGLMAAMNLGGGAPAAAPAPAAQTDSVGAFFAGQLGGGGASAAPAVPAAEPLATAAPAPTIAEEPKQKREKKKEKAAPVPVENGRDSPVAERGGGGGGGVSREVVRAAMYKLVANDNFIDLMVKEIKRSM